MNRIKTLFAAALAALVIANAAPPAQAAAKKEFNIAWSIYVGWMPWAYA
jgi:NitT/TauT family transport system substrate-binding protein